MIEVREDCQSAASVIELLFLGLRFGVVSHLLPLDGVEQIDISTKLRYVQIKP
jgi:hypothetical protein